MFDLRKKKGDRWLAAFVDYYLGFKRTCLLADGCSLPALTPEVERAGPEAQAAYRDELEQLIALFLADLPRASRRSARRRAIATLALLSGGLGMTGGFTIPS